MKILLSGIGVMGRRHYANLNNLFPEIKWIILRERSTHDEFSRVINAEVILSVNDIPRDTTAAFVCTPAKFRKNLYEKLIDFNIPMYVEKPLVSSYEDYLWLSEKLSLHKYTVPAAVGFNLRFLPVVQLVKKILQSKRLGNVCRALFEVGQYLPDWRPNQNYKQFYSAQKKMGGGVVLDLMHEVDLAHYFFGDFIKAHVFYDKFSQLEIDVPDTAAIILQRKLAPLVTINMDYVARQKIRQFRIVGDKASLFCDLFNKKLAIEDGETIEHLSLEEAFYDVKATYQFAVQKFLESTLNNALSDLSFEQSLPMHKLILESLQ